MASVLAFALGILFQPYLTHTTFALFYLAVIASAWFGGVGPAILAIFLGAVGGSYMLIGFQGAAGLGLQDGLNLLVFVFVSAVIGLFTLARERAARTLSTQREQLATTLMSIGDAVITTDRDGRVAFLNTVAEALTGWKQSEAKGRPLEEVFRILGEQDHQPAPNPAARALAEGRTVGLGNHTLLVDRNGKEIPIEDSASPIGGVNGTPSGVILVFRDVTQARAAERALLESEQRFRALIENSSDAVCLLSRDGTFQYASASNRRILGYEPDELVGRSAFELLHPDDREEFSRAFMGPFQAGEATSPIELRVLHKDGSYRWLEAFPSDLLANPALHGVVVNYRDVTERRQAAEALRQSRDQLEIVLSGVNEGITVQRPDGTLVFANDVAARQIGFASAAELLQTPVAEIVARFEIYDEDGAPLLPERLPGRLALQGKPATPIFVRFLHRATGEERWARVQATPVLNQAGTPTLAINIFSEMTERRRAERRNAAQFATARILAQAANLDQAVPLVIRTVGENLDWDAILFWIVDRESERLRLSASWHIPRLNFTEFEEVSQRTTFAVGVGLAGRAWQERSPVWEEDYRSSTYLRAPEAVRAGLGTGMAFPIFLGQDTFAVVECFSIRRRIRDAELVVLLNSLGGQIAQFVERQRVEEALRDSEERIRTIANTATDGIVTVDADSQILFVNRAIGEIFGFKPQELMGKSLTMLMPRDVRERHFAALKRYVHTNQKRLSWGRIEMLGRHKDGSLFPVEISLGEFVKDGRRFFTGLIRDIHERKEIQAQLEFQATILKNVRDSVVVTDLNGDVQYWNEGAERILGYSAAEMLGKSLGTIYPDQQDDELRGHFQDILEGREYAGEWRSVRKDGSEVWVDIKLTVMRNSAGRMIGSIGVSQEVTEQRRAVRALRDSEERFRSLSANSPVGIFLADIHGIVTYVNPALETISGLPEASLKDGWGQFVHHQDQTRASAAWQAYVRDGAPYDIEFRMVNPQGEARWWHARSSPMFSDEGALVGHVGTIEDITELRQSTDALRFLAEASSELANSLDFETTLKNLAHLAVPRLADWCAIDIVEDGTLRALEIAHSDPTKMRWAFQLREKYPVDMSASLGPANVIRTGRAELYPDITDETLKQAAKNEHELEILRSVGYRSVMIVPLTTRGETVGTISFVSAESGRRFGADDLALAEELGRRAATAMDNAALYRAEHHARRAAELASDRAGRLQAITSALSSALTPEDVANVVVHQGLAALGAAAGYLAVLTDGGKRLAVVKAVGYPPSVEEARDGVDMNSRVPAAEAVLRLEPIWLMSEGEKRERYPQLGPGHFSSNFPAYAAIPLTVEGRPLGALGLSFAQDRQLDEDERRFVLTLAQQSAQALERARLFEAESAARSEAEQGRERISFLSEASRRLSGTLDYDLILSALANLAVPALADWCTIDAVQEDGNIVMMARSHVDAGKVALIDELNARFPLASDAPYGYSHVIRTGVSSFIPNPFTSDLEAVAPTEEQRQLIHRIGFTSHICVPLAARGRVLGSITLNLARTPRCYTLDDLALAEEFARRGALALDNARLYAEAQQAVGVRDQFLSIASHELKTPLTSLMGYTELLRRSDDQTGILSERDARAVRTINSQAERLNKLINSLLDLSRIQQGQLSIEKKPLDLAALVRSTTENARLMTERHPISLALPKEPVYVVGDDLRLEQVVENLLQNAIKYSPGASSIEVELVVEQGQACLRVRDHGIGIPQAELEHLFTRFYRIQSGSTRHISGMGVGLYVVKEIVNAHGGEVGVTSEEGQGSTFSFCIPLISNSPEEPKPGTT